MITHSRSRQVSSRKLILVLSIAVGWTMSIVACSHSVKAPVGPGMVPAKQAKATIAAYKAGGWVPLQEPDSRFTPGTIFEAAPKQWPRWVSSLASCGVPEDVLSPVTSNTGSFRYSGDSTYGVKAVLGIKGVTAGPDFSRAQTATFVQSGAGASAIDIIKVGEWLSKNPSAFSSLCGRYLSKPNMFVAQESYRVGSGTYTLKDSKNAALNLKGFQFKILDLSADANAKITGESSLVLTVPVYTAVHQAVYAKDMLDLINTTRGRKSKVRFGDANIIKTLPQ